MLKKKLIPLLLLGLVLSGCGNANNNSSSPSEPNSESVTESVQPSESEDPVESESESEEPNESEQPSESESEVESESTGPSIPKEVTDKIGSKEAFRLYFDGEDNPVVFRPVKSMNYMILNSTSTKTTSTVATNTVYNNAIYKQSEYSDSTNPENSYTHTEYYGLNSDVYYQYNIYNGGSKASTSARYKIVDRVDNNYRDQMTYNEANSHLQEEAGESGICDLYHLDGTWRSFINVNQVVVTTWDLSLVDDGYYLIANGYHVKSNDQVAIYTTEYAFDSDVNITSATIIQEVYAKADFNQEAGELNENASIISRKSVYLLSVDFGAREDSEVLVYDNYFMSSVSNVYVTSTYTKTDGSAEYSEPNVLLSNSIIDYLDYASFVPSPATAGDIKSLVITSSSNEDAVYNDGYGWVTGKKNTSATLTLGNSFNHNLVSINVTVIANSEDGDGPVNNNPKPIFSQYDPFFCVSDNTALDTLTSKLVVTCKEGDKAIVGVPTTNEGPFNLDGYSMSLTMDKGYVSILSDQASYYTLDAYAKYYVYVELTILDFGNITLSVWGKSGDTPLITFDFTAVKGSASVNSAARGYVNSFLTNLKSQLGSGQGFTYGEIQDGEVANSFYTIIKYQDKLGMGSAANLLNALIESGFIPSGLTKTGNSSDATSVTANFTNGDNTVDFTLTITNTGTKQYEILAYAIDK